MQREIERELKKRIAKLRCGKAAGINGITLELLNYGGNAVGQWMYLLCDFAWRYRIPTKW